MKRANFSCATRVACLIGLALCFSSVVSDGMNIKPYEPGNKGEFVQIETNGVMKFYRIAEHGIMEEVGRGQVPDDYSEDEEVPDARTVHRIILTEGNTKQIYEPDGHGGIKEVGEESVDAPSSGNRAPPSGNGVLFDNEIQNPLNPQ